MVAAVIAVIAVVVVVVASTRPYQRPKAVRIGALESSCLGGGARSVFAPS